MKQKTHTHTTYASMHTRKHKEFYYVVAIYCGAAHYIYMMKFKTNISEYNTKKKMEDGFYNN